MGLFRRTRGERMTPDLNGFRQAECYEAFLEAEAFAVNLLREDQGPLSRRFARKDARKFEDIQHRAGTTGSPLLHFRGGYARLAGLVSAGAL